jgi:Xaa-Pro aminopeptidase
MLTEDLGALRRRVFDAKRAQLDPLLTMPLLLYWGKWEGPNIRVLTLADEFTRPTFLLCLPPGKTVAFTHDIETDAWADLKDRLEVVAYKTVPELKESLAERLDPFAEVGAEISEDFFGFDRLPPAFYSFLSLKVRLISADRILLPFRAVKTKEELALMKRAAELTKRLLDGIAAMVRPGVPEAEVVAYLTEGAQVLGTGCAFYPIVAAGPRSAHPHPQRRSANVIGRGDRVIVDFGVDYLGYKADLTRTYIAGGRLEDEPFYDVSVRLHELVRGADLKKQTPADLGAACARLVQEAGFTGAERHAYGHGLGVETHDPHPYIAAAPTVWTQKPFEDGMVFTFEPGFYDERGGFRFEENFVVWKGRAVPMAEFDARG